MPVATVLGTGNIQQFCGAANGIGLFFIKAVMASAHEKSPRKQTSFRNVDIIFYFLAFCNTIIMLRNGKKDVSMLHFAQSCAKYTILQCTN